MKKIRFSAGHGAGKTHNRGGIFFNEGDENLVFTDLLRSKFKNYEVDVKEIRNEKGRSNDWHVSTRSKFGNGADLFYSSHSNAGGGSGVEIYLSYQSLEYYDFAKELTKVISETLGTPNRGVKFRNYDTGKFETYSQASSNKANWYGELRNNKAKCAMLVEHFFHDNESDSKKYLSKKDELATNIVKVIAKHFDLKKKNETGAKWIKNDTGWWYRREDNTYPANKWEKIDGKWYHFNTSGYMQTGWLYLSGKWYYLDSSGAMKTGWVYVNNKWYYLNEDGSMRTGWVKYKDKWYYLKGKSGDMVSKEIRNVDGKWYYFNSSGEMLDEALVRVDKNGNLEEYKRV